MEKIMELADLLDRMSKEAIKGNVKTLIDMYVELKESLFVVFPIIIGLYSDERMKDLSEDAMYWPGQLERIIDAFEGHNFIDMIYIYDVLKAETYANIIEFIGELRKRNIAD